MATRAVNSRMHSRNTLTRWLAGMAMRSSMPSMARTAGRCQMAAPVPQYPLSAIRADEAVFLRRALRQRLCAKPILWMVHAGYLQADHPPNGAGGCLARGSVVRGKRVSVRLAPGGGQ